MVLFLLIFTLGLALLGRNCVKTGILLTLTAILAFPSAPVSAQSASGAPPELASGSSKEKDKVIVAVIPIQDEITEATFYLVRRALKDAIAEHAGLVVLDMKTPGGASDAMFEIMEALDKFPGDTATYVNDEAASAGAIIAGATREIYFSPKGVMGAAAAVTSDGGDIPETMRMKIASFFGSKVRTYAADKGRYRADVLRAMMEPDFELTIDDTVLKSKGELLSLTAPEAVKTYGDPPQPLLAAGIAQSLDEVLTRKYGAGRYEVTRLEPTWSETLAVFINGISPLLLGLGILAIYLEFKTPGFGLFGIAGVLLLGTVFLGSYVAGLSGHEPVLFFALGVALIAAELLLFPGVVVAVLTGVVLVLGSLVWAMADLWPGQPISVAWSGDAFARPAVNLFLGLLLATLLIVALLRYLPTGWIWSRLAVTGAGTRPAQSAGVASLASGGLGALLGCEAVAATDLRPGGFVEINGRRLEARVAVGTVVAGARVRVVGTSDFALTVEGVPS